jgi:hypothetical protein
MHSNEMSDFILFCNVLIKPKHIQGRDLAQNTVEVLYPEYYRSPVTAQKSRYGRFPPAADGWGTMHPILGMTPPLLAKEEGPPTYKDLKGPLPFRQGARDPFYPFTTRTSQALCSPLCNTCSSSISNHWT